MNTETSRLINRFLIESNYTDATKELYRVNLKYWFDWAESQGIDQNGLSPEHVQDFIADTEFHSIWSQSSKRILACVLRAFYKWRHPGLQHPITRIKVRKAPVRPRPFYNRQEIDQLLQSFGDSTIDVRNRAIAALAVDTGLRCSELCRLELSQVHIEACYLTVMVKGQRFEDAVFSAKTADILRAWLKIRMPFADLRTKTFFLSLGGHNSGSPLTRHGLRAIFYNFTQAAGLERGSPHRFRHSCANQLLDNGASTLHVQLGLRLKDLSQVPRYTSGRNLQQVRRFLPLANGA